MTIDQLNSMIIDLSTLEEFESQVRRECKVVIFDADLCRSLFGYHASYWVDIKWGRAGQRIKTE